MHLNDYSKHSDYDRYADSVDNVSMLKRMHDKKDRNYRDDIDRNYRDDRYQNYIDDRDRNYYEQRHSNSPYRNNQDRYREDTYNNRDYIDGNCNVTRRRNNGSRSYQYHTTKKASNYIDL